MCVCKSVCMCVCLCAGISYDLVCVHDVHGNEFGMIHDFLVAYQNCLLNVAYTSHCTNVFCSTVRYVFLYALLVSLYMRVRVSLCMSVLPRY